MPLFAEEVATGTILGTLGLVAAGAFGVLSLYLNKRAEIRVLEITTSNDKSKLELQFRLKVVEEDEVACKRNLIALTQEVTSLRIGHRGSPTAFYIWADWDEIILDVTEGVNFLGYRPAELVGEKVSLIVADSIKGSHHAGIERAKATSGSTGESIRIRRPDMAIKAKARHKIGHDVAVVVTLEPAVRKGKKGLRAEVSQLGVVVE